MSDLEWLKCQLRLSILLLRYNLREEERRTSRFTLRPAPTKEVSGEEDVANALSEALREHMGLEKPLSVALREVRHD